MFLISLIIHIGGSLELAWLSYNAMKDAIANMMQTPEQAAQQKEKKQAEAQQKKEEKASSQWIVSQRKYGSESGFIWVEDDHVRIPDTIPTQKTPPAEAASSQAPQESAAQKKEEDSSEESAQQDMQDFKEKSHPIAQKINPDKNAQASEHKVSDMPNPEQSDQEYEHSEESKVQSLQPTMMGQSGRKRTPEEILQTLVKHKIPAQPQPEMQKPMRARDQKQASSGSGLSVQMLQKEFRAFTAQRQKQQDMVLIPKGNDSFSSKSVYIDELPPEQQIRMDSYTRRMVWTLENIAGSLPKPRVNLAQEQGITKLSVFISLQLDRKGNITELILKKSCGYKEIDELALLTFKESKNFGDLPSFYTPETCTQHWCINYFFQTRPSY